MIDINKVLENFDDFSQRFRNKIRSLEHIMKLELILKDIQNNNNDCANHITISHLINKLEVALLTDFDSLTNVIFDVLGFEIFSNDLGIDGNKYVRAKYVHNLDKFNTIFGLKSLNRSFK